MQAHKLEVLVIDFDQIGAEGVKDAICTARYRNHCISPSVEAIQTVEIGPWSDDHPLNNSKTCEAEYKRLFERTTSPVSQMTDIEKAAEAIYKLIPANTEGAPEDYPWQPGGNSHMQDLARRMARAALDAAASHAQAPAAQQESIDSSQYFGKLLSRVAEFGFNGGHEKALIEYIDQHTAAAVAKAREEMRSTVSESAKLMADACSRANRAEQRAAIAASQPSKLPPPELIWLYTHCRALGMDCKSDSGKWEEDIGLWTVNLTNEIKALRASQQAEPVARKVVAWTAKDGDEWIVYDAESRTGQHIAKYQTKDHGVHVFPIYEDCKP